MKVLFTFYNPSGGMETLNRIRSRALRNSGIECHLLYTMDGQGRQNITDTPVFVTGVDQEIFALIEKEKYDLIVVCSDIFLMEKIRYAGYAGRMIFEVQGLGTLEDAHTAVAAFVPYIRQYADAVLYPRTHHLESLMKNYFPTNKLHYCIDDPMDCTNFGYVAYPPKPFPIVGWIGRLEANKNPIEFLRIGKRLLDAVPELYFWMFEDATLANPDVKEQFEKEVDALGLRSRLVRYSNVAHQQMDDYLSMIGDSGGFLCSTSVLEGFGYAVLEAMLCRCPVLCTDSDGIRRFVMHNYTGKYYNRGDYAGAAAEGLSLMKDIQLRESIRRSGEHLVRSQFSESAYVQQFNRMWSELKIQ